VSSVDLEMLDVATLSWLAGSAANEHLLGLIRAAGHANLRISHGYVFQLLIDGPKTIGEIAAALGFTQQAASKQVAELDTLGYLEIVQDETDGRIRRVALSIQGKSAVAEARSARADLETRLSATVGLAAISAARNVLLNLLETTGGFEAARRRRARPAT
jgi:DNA-binding MarR family transcriptional regulator